jgi:hypothetical protein
MRPINITVQFEKQIILRVVQSRHLSEDDQLRILVNKVTEDIVLGLTVTKGETITVNFDISSNSVDIARVLIYGTNYAIEPSDV